MKRLAPWFIPLFVFPGLIALTQTADFSPEVRTALFVVLGVLTIASAVVFMLVYAKESKAARERRQRGNASGFARASLREGDSRPRPHR